MTDDPEAITAALRRVALERDQARWMVDSLKERCQSLRRQLRKEQAAHQQTHMRLEALRALLPEKNSPC